MADTAGPLAISSPRLILRLATLDDVPSEYRIGADPRNTVYQPHLNLEPHSLERTAKWITSCNEKYHATHDGCFLGIVERSTGEYIGDTGQGWGKSKTGWTGVMLDHEKRGHGYAVEALWSVMRWSFAEPAEGELPGSQSGCGLDEVALGTAAENREMRGVLEKVFSASGTEREASNPEKRGLKAGAREVIFKISKDEWADGMEVRVRQWLEQRTGISYA